MINGNIQIIIFGYFLNKTEIFQIKGVEKSDYSKKKTSEDKKSLKAF